jgi:nickel-dependent lactate racemase
MRIAKTLEDLSVGTPVEINGAYRIYKGIVIKTGYGVPHIKVLFADGSDIIYYEEDLEQEQIIIVEIT